MNLKTCVDPSGQFIYGIHQPNFEVRNLRESDKIRTLGVDENNTPVDNHANFPSGTVTVDQADWVFEIPNAFPFRGATFIARSWAEEKAAHPEKIRLPEPPNLSHPAAPSKKFAPMFQGKPNTAISNNRVQKFAKELMRSRELDLKFQKPYNPKREQKTTVLSLNLLFC